MNIKKKFKDRLFNSLKKLRVLKRYKVIKKLKMYLWAMKHFTKFRLNSVSLGSKTKIRYIVSFIFSPKNTFLYITDVKGVLKRYYSAGSINIKGKQKKNRILMLTKLCKVLRSIHNYFLKHEPIAIHLINVGSFKKFIMKKLKKKFLIKVIKSYNKYPYNGCRKKKIVRKKQRGAHKRRR